MSASFLIFILTCLIYSVFACLLIANRGGSHNMPIWLKVLFVILLLTKIWTGWYRLHTEHVSRYGFNRCEGYYSGFHLTTGRFNCYIGDYAGYSNQRGSFNLCLGDCAGWDIKDSFNVRIGTYRVF